MDESGTEKPTLERVDSVNFNSGASLPDVEALKAKDTESIESWQARHNIDLSNQVKIVKLAHVRYQYPDLTSMEKFLVDFGMTRVKKTDNCIWYRGYGDDPYVYFAQAGEKKFLGGTYIVESMAELEKATKIPGAGKIEELLDAPGGGFLLTITDPEGFPINLMYGQVPAKKGKLPTKLIINNSTEKPRIRTFHHFTPGPAAVHRLGHYVLLVKDYEKQLQFYASNFNLAPSDILSANSATVSDSDDTGTSRNDVAAFIHIDRGDEPADHHSFLIAANPTQHVHHSSFEVHDLDTQQMGHEWLGKQGYNSAWGVGRHTVSSQLFDYWWDPSGNMMEHYADGDMVNRDTPIAWTDVGEAGLSVWGPVVPENFLG